jgi:hypothetical protein
MELTDKVKRAIAEEVELFEYSKRMNGPLCVISTTCSECPYTKILGERCTAIWMDFPCDNNYKLLVAYTLADACGVKVGK